MPTPPPRIVVLDGFTLNPGDLSWNRLQTLGNCTIHDRTPPDLLLSRAADAELVLTNKVVLSRQTIESLPQLKYIGVIATGYNVVDIEAATLHNITVTNVPTYSTASVAQTVFAHVLNFAQHTSDHSQAVHAGRWSSAIDFCFWDTPQIELAGMTLGIVGFGRIGRATAKLADAFGMKVLVNSRTPTKLPEYAQTADLDTLFSNCDIVSLHCPLTPQTQQLVNADRLKLMRPTALLVNTSRGPLIDEQALAEALQQNKIAGAALDVLSVEPPPADHPLLGIKNCFITPHIAWATRSARTRLLNTVTNNITAYLAGQPHNVVN